MAAKGWLLVEWVEESNVFPSYGMVHVDTLAYNGTDLRPENEIFICVNHENPRRAKILRISESKRYIQEQKDILERQDQQVKNVLQICMRTIRDVQSNNMLACGVQYNMPHVITASNAESASGSASDSEPEPNRQLERSIMQSINKSRSQYPKHGRKAPKIEPVRGTLNTTQTRRMISSTPLPGNSAQQNVTLCFDQGTQTEPIPLRPSLRKVEEMEAVLKGLYRRFQSLVAQVNIRNDSSNGPIGLSDSEQNNDVSYVEPNNAEPWTERNNTDYEDHANVSGHVQDVGAEAVIVENGGNQSLNTSNFKVEDRINPNALQVRRMSAQTTNNIEIPSYDADLVSIGDGNTKVPVRLLNDINWNSHTTATRQLLQAVFPRRVLATHSLTGKQSPAFMNRPPKKILDPKLVEDIVKIVSTRCGVPKNLVRNSITIKCTDEAKLYRNRLQYKLQRQMNSNEENRPPSTPSSDESSNTVMN